VRGLGCDTTRLHWTGSRGHPRRRSGRWAGTDTAGDPLAFALPGDRLSLAFGGELPLTCTGFTGPAVFRLAGAVLIRSNAFRMSELLTDGSTVVVRARFVGARRAEGTWRRSFPVAAGVSPCDSGALAWSASR